MKKVINTVGSVETFNIIGTSSTILNSWIGAQKEHKREIGSRREDIYFHLNDDKHTRIFYMEAKHLPMNKTKDKDEYVSGDEESGKISGGIQRYKILIHGNPNLNYNGMLAYIENNTIESWVVSINKKLGKIYPEDKPLSLTGYQNEYISTHRYTTLIDKWFIMHHFWINLT